MSIPALTPVKRSYHDIQSAEKCRDSDFGRFVRILLAPAVAFGSSFAFALQFVLLTPFAISLGVTRETASLVWLMGPVTGIVVQPLTGHLSDVYHRRHATRLPIVSIAALILAISHFGIAFATDMAPILHTSPLAILITSFWVFDAANNAIIVTIRAMLSDRFGKEHRMFAFSVLQFWTSLGFIMGYLTAQTEWSTPNSADVDLYTIRACFVISAAMVVIGAVLSFMSVFEKRACRMRFHTVHTGARFRFDKCLEPCLVSIMAGSALTWFGWFAQQVYQSDFIGRRVTSASGPQIAAYGLVISSILSCITGLLVIPLLLSFTGSDSTTLFRLWSISSSLQGVNLLMSPLVQTETGAILWEASTGPMYAVALTIPFMLVANGCDHGSSGRVMALVNVAVCSPQLLVSLGGGILVAIAKSDVILFAIGGGLCMVASMVLWVPAGAGVPPWSEKSTASIIASTSDLFSFASYDEDDFGIRNRLLPR